MTTTPQHTPGPWQTTLWPDESGNRYPAVIVTSRNRDQHLICSFEHSVFRESQAAANAALIAAAPDLLVALEALLPVAQAFERQASKGTGGRRGGPVFERARAAIAKARGE